MENDFFSATNEAKNKPKGKLKRYIPYMHSGDGKTFLIFSAAPKTVLFIK